MQINTYLVLFFSALIVTSIGTPLAIKVALQIGAVDQPSPRRTHSTPMPRLGGLAIFVGFFLPLGALLAYALISGGNRLTDELQATISRKELMAIFVGSLFLTGVGFWDDLRGVRAEIKLLVQLVAATAVYMVGCRINQITLPVGESGVSLQMGSLSYPVTVFWILAVTNAINIMDGLDGLATGIVAIAASVLFVLAFNFNQIFLTLFCITLLGATLGFLRYNFSPARVFLGDTGSLFLGFLLGCFTIWASQKGAGKVSLYLPIVLLGLPFTDITLAVLRRISTGRALFAPDKDHIHHQILRTGRSHRSTVLSLYAVSGVLAMATLFLAYTRPDRAAIMLVVLMVAGFLGLRWSGLLRRRDDLRERLLDDEALASIQHIDEILGPFESAIGRCRSVSEAWETALPLWRELGVLDAHMECRPTRLAPVTVEFRILRDSLSSRGWTFIFPSTVEHGHAFIVRFYLEEPNLRVLSIKGLILGWMIDRLATQIPNLSWDKPVSDSGAKEALRASRPTASQAGVRHRTMEGESS